MPDKPEDQDKREPRDVPAWVTDLSPYPAPEDYITLTDTPWRRRRPAADDG